jgi:hypothetical protein
MRNWCSRSSWRRRRLPTWARWPISGGGRRGGRLAAASSSAVREAGAGLGYNMQRVRRRLCRCPRGVPPGGLCGANWFLRPNRRWPGPWRAAIRAARVPAVTRLPRHRVARGETAKRELGCSSGIRAGGRASPRARAQMSLDRPFEELRPGAFAVAYRMLARMSEAEDRGQGGTWPGRTSGRVLRPQPTGVSR